MFDKLQDIPDEVKKFIWLMIVSFVGGLVGFITKTTKTLQNKPLKDKLYNLVISMLSSMFIAYITYELIKTTIDREGLAVAISGFMAYVGTDILIIIQDRLIEKIKTKIDAL